MKAKKYIADLTAGGLLLAESRVVAETLLDDLLEPAWRDLIEIQNILRKKSPRTALRYARVVRNRLQPLGKEFIADVIAAHGQLYTQLILLSAILHSPVIQDFMTAVIADARRQYQSQLPPLAWTSFIDERARVITDLCSLSDTTIHKSGTNLLRILVEAGYLESAKTGCFLPVYLLPETHQWLERMGKGELASVLECTL
ncbi:MAG: DUF1819 family protein [Gimesia sp.]